MLNSVILSRLCISCIIYEYYLKLESKFNHKVFLLLDNMAVSLFIPFELGYLVQVYCLDPVT